MTITYQYRHLGKPTVHLTTEPATTPIGQASPEIAALRAELTCAYDQIKKLEAALEECLEYFEGRADADCDQDGYIPNKEMLMLSSINETLHGPGGF